NNGKIFSFSIAQVAPPGFEVPHVQAYIDLDEGVRVFSLLVEYGDVENLRTGLPVKLVIVNVGENEEGKERLTYCFRPIFEEDER
ncbi:MAG: OB-fold domain-containing protein, partial [Deltaproteobacteria bacterium]